MDYLLRVISGPDEGREHLLQRGPNLIGRGGKAILRLTPEDVSWEHAIVTCQDGEYFIENLSAVGTWVGDAKITGRVRLKPRDLVRLSGKTVLRLDSTSATGGLLGSRMFLGTLLAVMLAGAVAAVVYSSGAGASEGVANWDRAYSVLNPWLRQQANRRLVSGEAMAALESGWRLDQAADYEHAQAYYSRLQVLLAAADGQLHCLQWAEEEVQTSRGERRLAQKSLQKLLSPPAPPDDLVTEKEKATAMAEFVERRLTYCVEQVKAGKKTYF